MSDSIGEIQISASWRPHTSLTREVSENVVDPHDFTPRVYVRTQTVGVVFRNLLTLQYGARLSVGKDAFKLYGPFSSVKPAVTFIEFKYGKKLTAKTVFGS